MKRIIILILMIIMLNYTVVIGEELNLSGQNYILIEEKSGRVLLDRNAHNKMPIASTTKIMTALIALELGNVEDKVKIIGKNVNVEGSSIYLKDGEEIKLIDLIYGLMLRSGNDAALAIAYHISGNNEDFVALMNNKAKEIGAYNTNFMNPNGLHNDNHYSTAYDLALITRNAFSVKGFEEVSKSKDYKSTREFDNYFVNKNKTLWEYKGGDGVKIGYTIRAGRCLVSSATQNDMRLIAVTLRDGNWFNDNYKLMDYGFNNYKLFTMYNKEQLITQVNVFNGKKDKVPLVVDKGFVYPLMEEERSKIKISINNNSNQITAPIFKGEVLGSVEVYLDGILIKKDNLVARYDVGKKNIFEKLTDMLNRMNN